MTAFENWYNALDPDERPDHTDAMEAFNAGMTRAAEIITDCKNKQAGLCCDNCNCVAAYKSVEAILKARDG